MARWLSIDPGETVGWALWEDQRLLDAGQTPLWPFADEVFAATVGELGFGADGEPMTPPDNLFTGGFYPGGLERLVIEEFALYPPGVGPGPPPPWDKVLTARLIGALQLIARLEDIPVFFQGANIKVPAEQAGAEALFAHPLHENRHQNDAIRHGVYWMVKNERLREVAVPEKD